jgi:hypothetical protein
MRRTARQSRSRVRGATTRLIRWLPLLLPLMAAVILVAWDWQREATADVIVYRSRSCECCLRWAAHLRDNGLRVYVRTQDHVHLVRERYGVPDRLSSCHTARVGGYTVEGHVPAADIRRLLRERPAVAGIAVPDMPIGSPGMEQGDRHDPYAVLAFDTQGGTRVFERH